MASHLFGKCFKRRTLAVALGLCLAGGVHAQSTTGTIFGNAGTGTTITVQSQSGVTRTVPADAAGRYNIGSLPVGKYTVTVVRDGQTIGTREVTVLTGSGSDVSFAGSDVKTLEALTVTATGLLPIDVTTTDTRMVLTAQELTRLPIAPSAEAIALLAPGAISGAAGYFSGLVSFGGSGVTENAYYVNGFFTGEALSNLGGFALPFRAIEQQETFLGGYSAKYGRSDGGVINQIGKRGTNEWHFGGAFTLTPRNMRGYNTDLYMPNMSFTGVNANPNLPSTCGAAGTSLCQYQYQDPSQAGKLHSRGKESNSWSKTYTAYVGGPIIADRLFFYTAAEYTKDRAIFAPTLLSSPPFRIDQTTNRPRLYVKLDWTINDNNYLEFTHLQEKTDQTGIYSTYNFASGTTGSTVDGAAPDAIWRKNRYDFAKYTGYLTDSLTLSAMYGKSNYHAKNTPTLDGAAPFLSTPTNENPAFWVNGAPVTNKVGGYLGRDGTDTSDALRIDLEWKIGDHALTAGIDNLKFEATDEGQSYLTTRWLYNKTLGNVQPGIAGSPVSPSNPNGYYVRRMIFSTATDMSLDQKAWYLEDRWQVVNNLLLTLGLRNDQFTNRNSAGVAYLDSKNQWAPRLGAAWDVFGDAKMKVFGNAGRYYLAMPNQVAIRGASASTYTWEWFTYTGIAADGTPTGLQPIHRLDGEPDGKPWSANSEYGVAPDVLSFAPKDLKNMYQDEFILGAEKMIGDKLMVGVKGTYRSLKSAIDDIGDMSKIADKLTRMGIDPDSVKIPGGVMFNPGATNTYSLPNVDANGNLTGTRTDVTMSFADWGFTDPMKRDYKAIDLYLERPWDGKWYVRVDYTWSKSQGNMEGQVKSEFGQADISKTQDWDAAALMKYATGYLANDRRHQLKVRGAYAVTDEWTATGILRIQSGMPFSCLGYFNPGNVDENSDAGDPIGYGSSYHTCFGKIEIPGSMRNPWTRTVDVGVIYRPKFLDRKAAFGLDVRNLFNVNNVLQANVTSESAPYSVSNNFMLVQGRQTPRTVMFTAAYDW